MANVVVLGAGLGGTIMAYELRDGLGAGHTVSVVNKGAQYSFVPSNPWVAVGWRERAAVTIDLEPVFKKRGIDLYPQGAKRLHPAEHRIELLDGQSVPYDYLVIATGPDLAFDEIEGFGPEHFTQSVCHIDHALKAKPAFDELVKNPGPVIIGAVQGASCFGPAYEFAFILEKALRDAKVRDRVPMTFVTSEPPISAISASTASATPRACSKAPCASATSSGSATPRSTASRTASCTSPKWPRTAASRPRTSCPLPIR